MSIQDRHHVQAIIRSALTSLDRRDKLIVECRLMRDSEDAMTLVSIGRRLGITRERARQIEVRAKLKLKQRILELTGSQYLDGINVDSAA